MGQVDEQTKRDDVMVGTKREKEKAIGREMLHIRQLILNENA